MGRRRGWKPGDHLIKDEESGFTIYASEAIRDSYGVLKKKSEADSLHPQEFIRARRDPYPVYPVAPPVRDYDFSQSLVGSTVGTTNVPVITGPASHLFSAGIGYMRIEYDFIVG